MPTLKERSKKRSSKHHNMAEQSGKNRNQKAKIPAILTIAGIR
jgi:hypothetical protein